MLPPSPPSRGFQEDLSPRMHDADTYDCSSSKRELVRDLVENIKHLKKMALDSENVKLLFRVKNVLFQIGETHGLSIPPGVNLCPRIL